MANEKLIDAERFKRVLQRYANAPHVTKSHNYSKGMRLAIETCIELLEVQPTVDAAPVVRCKDCRWARPQDHREPTMTPAQSLICECFMHHHIPAPWGARLAVKQDGFCSCGERRTDNG